MSSAEENEPLLNPADSRGKYDGDEYPELTGCGATLACDPRRALHRYLMLIVMCFLGFGSYFCYDNPAALQDSMEFDLSLNTSQFMTFYALYSWPNVIMCFLGGFLIDRVFGIRWGAIIFSLCVTAGQAIFALGALVNSFGLMQAGRFIFGIGGESLCVATNTYAVSWFKGRELNMVFGLQLSVSRVGSTVNMNVMRPLYDAIGQSMHLSGYLQLGTSLMIALAFCLFSLTCAFVLAYFDKRAKRILKTEDAKAGQELIKVQDVLKFPGSFWILAIICVTYYVAIFPFIGLGLMFFEMKWGMTHGAASLVNSLVYVISAVASPFFGLCIDKTGKNVTWVTIGVIATLACHASLAFTFINPYVPMIVMGLSYSVLASALWPMVSLLPNMQENWLGTAYGLMQAVQNLGLAVVAMVAGLIVDARGYLILEVFFLCWLCVALIACAVLFLLDASAGGFLNMTAWTRKAKLELASGGPCQQKAALMNSEVSS